MNIGIIGFGKIGKIRFNTIQAIDGKYRVTKICDISTNQGIFSKDIKFTTDYNDILNDKNIDIIFVCTPNYLNKKLVVEALNNNKHVFCEKPPGINLAELEEMIEAEKKNPHLKLMFGFNHRHHESMIYAKKLIDSGEYGKILWMRGRYGKSVDENFYKTWRASKKTAGGGILLDQGIHLLDLFLMMCGNFEEVHAFISDLYWHLDGVEDNAFVILRNKKGQVASMHSTMTQWRHLFSFEVFLEKGHIVINGLVTPSHSYGKEVLTVAQNQTASPAVTWTREESFNYVTDSCWEREVRVFFDAIEKDKKVPIGNSEDALKLMRIIDKIYVQKNKFQK